MFVHKTDCTFTISILCAPMFSGPCQEVFVKVILHDCWFFINQVVLDLGGSVSSWSLKLTFGCAEVPLGAWEVLVSSRPERSPLWLTCTESTGWGRVSELGPTGVLWMDLWVCRRSSVVNQCLAASLPWPGACRPAGRKVGGSVAGQSTALCCRFHPRLGRLWEAPN